jgi:DNA repair protein RadC
MTTHSATLANNTQSSNACHTWLMLRELTYHYQTKRAADGNPTRLAPFINGPRECAAAMMALLGEEAVEVFGLLCLTTKHRVICWHEVSRGTLDSTIVHPREVFKPAIMSNAAAIVVGHCHPSGDPTPSPDDVMLTHRLVQAGQILGIDVLDHIVVGDDAYVSFKETARL